MTRLIDERLIDRLVDDELAPAERRALLADLDREPEGWRRCALAFLEAQSWRSAFEAMTSGPSSDCTEKKAAHERSPVSHRRIPHALGVAAGIVAALVLGWTARGPWLRSHTSPTGKLAADAHADRGRDMPRTGSDSIEADANPMPGPQNAGVLIPPRDSAESLQVATRAMERTQSRNPTPSPLPETLRRQFERRGFQVENQRGLMTLKLKDGRRMALPVEELKVHYVGRPTL